MAQRLDSFYKRMGIIQTPDGKTEYGKGQDVRSSNGQLGRAFDIPECNLRDIHRMDRLMGAKGIKVATRFNYLRPIARLCHRIRKPLKEMTEDDIVSFASWVEEGDKQGASTKNGDMLAVKRFFKILHGTEHYPDCVRFIQRRTIDKRIAPEDLLTRAEIERMLDQCDHPRDKCIISLLYETACREGELVSCRIKNVTFFAEGYAILNIPEVDAPAKSGAAKTGSYSALIIDSLPYLKSHLNHHPNKDDPDAPLFYALHPRYGSPLETGGLYSVVKSSVRRAGLKKRVYPHLFRHTANTRWAEEGYTAEEINLRSGRKQHSRIAHTYIHLTQSGVHKKVLQRRGIVKKEASDQGDLLGSVACWSCGARNPISNSVCLNDQCNMPLQVAGKDRERFIKMANAISVYDTLNRASEKEPRVIEYLKKIEELLKSKPESGRS